MPKVIIENQEVEIPPVIPGAELSNLPAVRDIKEPGDTVYYVDPKTREFTIVEPAKEYTLEDGFQVDVAPRTLSGQAP